MVTEHGGQAPRLGVLHGAAQVAAQAVAVEDVVPENERAGLAGGELLADHERLGQAVGARLDRVGQVHAVVRAVAQQALEVRQVGGRGDDQDVADAGHHEDGQRVVDHRLVVDRQQLLAGDGGERVQARARPAREDDALHDIFFLGTNWFNNRYVIAGDVWRNAKRIEALECRNTPESILSRPHKRRQPQEKLSQIGKTHTTERA